MSPVPVLGLESTISQVQSKKIRVVAPEVGINEFLEVFELNKDKYDRECTKELLKLAIQAISFFLLFINYYDNFKNSSQDRSEEGSEDSSDDSS